MQLQDVMGANHNSIKVTVKVGMDVCFILFIAYVYAWLFSNSLYFLVVMFLIFFLGGTFWFYHRIEYYRRIYYQDTNPWYYFPLVGEFKAEYISEILFLIVIMLPLFLYISLEKLKVLSFLLNAILTVLFLILMIYICSKFFFHKK